MYKKKIGIVKRRARTVIEPNPHSQRSAKRERGNEKLNA